MPKINKMFGKFSEEKMIRFIFGKDNISSTGNHGCPRVGPICSRPAISRNASFRRSEMPSLFDPMEINQLQIPNRFVRSATFDNLGRNGSVSEAQIKLYDTLSQGEIGLIISGGLFPTRDGMGTEGQLSVETDEDIPSLQKLVQAVHANGALIAGQILHCGFRSREAVTGVPAVGPSAVVDPESGARVRELGVDEIHGMIDAYIQAARRIAEAGFDAVQLHAAHGWFLSAFLSPVMNQREDEWGGSPENRARFLRTICRGIRQATGPDFPLLLKLGLKDYHPQGKTLAEGLAVAKLLEKDGVDAIEVSEGIEEKWGHHIRKDARHPYYLEECRQARPILEKPLILVGGMREFADMQAVLNQNVADAVSLCRPFIQDPHVIAKYRRMEVTGSLCRSCNGCGERMIEGHFGCVLNRQD